jgi:hypothetical protein
MTDPSADYLTTQRRKPLRKSAWIRLYSAAMGKDQKLRSDPARAREHAAGVPVNVIQILTHNQLGAIGYFLPRYWVFHAHMAEAAANQLVDLHRQLVRFPVNAMNAIRSIEDMAYIETVYRAGTSMVINIVLALQHLCEEIERTLKIQLRESTLDGRLKEALGAAALAEPTTRPGYAKFVELEAIRDAIEHPKGTNTYNPAPGQWDQVPLAWFLSERGPAAFGGCSQFVKSVADDWQRRAKELDAPAELTVERGVYSQRQFKKPPSEPAGSTVAGY